MREILRGDIYYISSNSLISWAHRSSFRRAHVTTTADWMDSISLLSPLDFKSHQCCNDSTGTTTLKFLIVRRLELYAPFLLPSYYAVATLRSCTSDVTSSLRETGWRWENGRNIRPLWKGINSGGGTCSIYLSPPHKTQSRSSFFVCGRGKCSACGPRQLQSILISRDGGENGTTVC